MVNKGQSEMKRIRSLDSNVGATHQNQINPFLISAEQQISVKYKPRLFGNFIESEDFLYTLEVLETATEDDTVELHISSCGGSASALSTLIHAMKKCNAPIHVIMTGTVASAATFPMFFCDSWECAEDASFLFHEAVLGAAPETMSANKAYTQHAYEHTERLLRNTYEGFFTDEEMQELLSGDQKWLFPEDVESRFSKMIEYREQQSLAQQEAEEASQTAQAPKKSRKKKEENIDEEDVVLH